MYGLIVKNTKIINLLKPKTLVCLGRWEHRLIDKQKELKSIWANSDNCGDRICGTPRLIHNIIKNEIK
jgi:hypothetical protein